MKLTQAEVEALQAVENGADVYSYTLAKTLRSIEKNYPGLVDITKPMAYSGNCTDQVPCFGAICTTEGKDAISKSKEQSV